MFYIQLRIRLAIGAGVNHPQIVLLFTIFLDFFFSNDYLEL